MNSAAKCGSCHLPFPKRGESPIGRALCACRLDLHTGKQAVTYDRACDECGDDDVNRPKRWLDKRVLCSDCDDALLEVG